MTLDSSYGLQVLEFSKMKLLFKLFPVMLMAAAISVAGCGDTAGGGDKGGDKGGAESSESSDKGASNTPATSSDAAMFVSTDVNLPKMHWT
jgi:hypothetical protein